LIHFSVFFEFQTSTMQHNQHHNCDRSLTAKATSAAAKAAIASIKEKTRQEEAQKKVRLAELREVEKSKKRLLALDKKLAKYESSTVTSDPRPRQPEPLVVNLTNDDEDVVVDIMETVVVNHAQQPIAPPNTVERGFIYEHHLAHHPCCNAQPCQIPFQAGVEVVGVLGCGHVFHADCFDKYFRGVSCPCCERQLQALFQP
jgi:hypothetical protein